MEKGSFFGEHPKTTCSDKKKHVYAVGKTVSTYYCALDHSVATSHHDFA